MDQTAVALAHARLSATQQAQSDYGPALESIAAALELAPGVGRLWSQFSDLVRYFNFRHPADPRLRELLGRALEHPAVDPGNLVRPISSIALSRPRGEVLQDPLLLRLLEDALVRDPGLHAILAEERRAALFGRPLPLEALVAIAHQAWNTEYLYGETPEETAAVREIGPGAPPHRHAVYAAYRPLSTLGDLKTPLASLARRQIAEPAEERRLRASIRLLSGAAGRVSRAVQAQYEENPYPRWLRAQSSFEPGTVAQILRELFPHADLAGAPDSPPRVLVAGCGTGQNAISTARRFRDASVLAVDLSLASLAYAQRKTRELGLAGIEYAQADLLAIGSLAERFDLIECSGVLHHLEDPFAGWRSLAALLKPGGFMRIGLYSETGRRNVARARELIAAEGLAATPEGIRRARGLILARGDDPLLAGLARNEDFYSLSGCRDLLFHVQEHRFTLPQIEDMIRRLGLRFVGFELADGSASTEGPDYWHRHEQQHPDAFARMYQFWVRAP